MKRVRFILTGLLILFIANVVLAQTADQIIDRYVKAVGGAEKLSSIKSMKTTGKVTLTMMAFELTFTTHSKRPNKQIVESVSPMGKVVQCTNGTDAWMINDFQGMTEPTPAEGKMKADIIRGGNFDGWMINRDKNGITAKFISEEESEGKVLQKVEITYKDGHVSTLFFDKSTGLLSKTSTMEEGAESTAEYHDFKDFHGQLIPTRIVRNAGGQEFVIETFTVEENIEIADSVFEMPASTTEK